MDNFIKWMRKMFRENPTTPPKESWENISMQLDIDDSWEEISRKMAIDEGWENISRRLDSGKRFLIGTRVALSAAASVLVIVGISLFLSQERVARDITPSYSYRDAKNVDTESGMIAGALTDRHIDSRLTSSLKDPEFALHVTGSLREEKETALPAIRPETEYLSEQIPYAGMAPAGRLRKLPAVKPEPAGQGATTAAIEPAETAETAERETAPAFSRTTYLGVSTSLKNTWLLNTATMAGLRKYDLNTTLPGFGFNLGISGRRQLSPGLALQGDLSFISQTGQRYNRYMEGQYVSENIMLSYTTLTLALKYTFAERVRGNNSMKYNLYIGPYAGLLGSAETRIDSERDNITSRYSRSDWGGIAGIGHDIYPSPNLCISTALFVRHGFTNIYSGDESVPADLRYTNTGAIELFISIQHSIGK